MENGKFKICIASFSTCKKSFKTLVCETMAECIELKTMFTDLNKKEPGLGDQEIGLISIGEANRKSKSQMEEHNKKKPKPQKNQNLAID